METSKLKSEELKEILWYPPNLETKMHFKDPEVLDIKAENIQMWTERRYQKWGVDYKAPDYERYPWGDFIQIDGETDQDFEFRISSTLTEKTETPLDTWEIAHGFMSVNIDKWGVEYPRT